MKRIKFFSLALTAIFILSSQASLVNAAEENSLTNNSPNPGMMKIGNTPGVTNHILIWSNHGKVPEVRLGIYFDSKPVGNQNFAITTGGDNRNSCRMGGVSEFGNGVDVAYVTFAGQATNTVERGANNNAKNGYSKNIQRSHRGKVKVAGDPGFDDSKFGICNSFYKNYTMNANSATLDSDTGLYKAVMVVKLAGPERFDENDAVTLTFGVKGPNGVRIGNIDTNQSGNSQRPTPNNSIVAKQNLSGSVRAVFPFGLSCNDPRGGRKTISLYDADNGQGNQRGRTMSFYVQEFVPSKDNPSNGAWRTLRSNEFGNPQNGAFSTETSFAPKASPNPKANNQSSIDIKAMKPYTRYRMVVVNLVADLHNYVYVGLPGDSIYGSEDFQCRAHFTGDSQVRVMKRTGGGWSAWADSQNADVGDKIQFRHVITNQGPKKATIDDANPSGLTDADPKYNQTANKGRWRERNFDIRQGFTDEDNTNYSAYGRYGGVYGGDEYEKQQQNEYFNDEQTYKVTRADAEKKLCERYDVTPETSPFTGSPYGTLQTDAACVTIKEAPPLPDRASIQIWGYDARSGGEVITGTREFDDKTFGNWSEYGNFSQKKTVGFASASALAGGTKDPETKRNDLTFANTRTNSDGIEGCNNAYGCYGDVSYPDDLVNRLKARCEMYAETDITIDGRSISSGNAPSICTHGTVRIRGDITYSDENTNNARSLPQLVIIASDIIIDKDVKNVDAWLIATKNDNATEGGRISTCAEVKDGNNQFPSFATLSSKMPLKKDSCDNPLTFTGPVIADEIYLFRTTPLNKDDDFAERFNLRADAFLWAYNGGSGGDVPIAQTTSIRELPPRF